MGPISQRKTMSADDPFGDVASIDAFDGGEIPILKIPTPEEGHGLKLSFALEGIPKMDTFGKSDPMCLVYAMDHDDIFRLVGRTEYIKDVVDCTFEKTVTVPAEDATYSQLKIDVYDLDKFKTEEQIADVANHDLIGTVTLPIRKLVQNPSFLQRKDVRRCRNHHHHLCPRLILNPVVHAKK